MLIQQNIEFYTFGQANESGYQREEWYDVNTGAALGVMIPMQNALPVTLMLASIHQFRTNTEWINLKKNLQKNGLTAIMKCLLL